MCVPIDTGYRMKNGIEVTHEQIRNGQLSDEHLDELRANPMNAVDGSHIRTNLHDLRGDIQNLINSMRSPEVINPMIDNRIKERSKTFLFDTSKVLLAFSVIIGILYKIYDWILIK